MIKQKKAEKEKSLMENTGLKREEEYLKKTANLGQLVEKMQRPWYVKAVKPENDQEES